MEVMPRTRFLRFCGEELLRRKERSSIGLLSEKSLHSVLKYWVSDDPSDHEVKIFTNAEKKGYVVADVLTKDGEIVEIQTGKLYPLLKKMTFYMESTDRSITLIHPVFEKKTLSWLDPEIGEVVRRRVSPKKETPISAVGLLAPFAAYLGDARFSFWVPLLCVEEYRFLDGWGDGGKRGSHRYEIFPNDCLSVTVLKTKADYAALLPNDLPPRFTAKEFAAKTRLGRGFLLYDTLAVYCALGILKKGEKIGRSYIYEKI